MAPKSCCDQRQWSPCASARPGVVRVGRLCAKAWPGHGLLAALMLSTWHLAPWHHLKVGGRLIHGQESSVRFPIAFVSAALVTQTTRGFAHAEVTDSVADDANTKDDPEPMCRRVCCCGVCMCVSSVACSRALCAVQAALVPPVWLRVFGAFSTRECCDLVVR